jgi:hypothetical protein
MTVANADLQAIVADERQRLAAERAPAPPSRTEPPAQQRTHPAPEPPRPAGGQQPVEVPVKQAEAPSGPFAAAVQMMEQSLDRWLDGDRSSGPVKAFIAAHDRATRQGANGRTLIAEVVDRVVPRRGEGAGVSADLGGFLAAIERQRKREQGMGR